MLSWDFGPARDPAEDLGRPVLEPVFLDPWPQDPADAYNRERMESADGVLLGRTSWEGFGSYWPGVADAPEDPDNRALSDDNRTLSRIYNQLPKVVVSDTCVPADDHPWHDSTTVVARDRIAAWLADHDGEYVVYGSHVMWNGLLAQGLVDELHLMVSPQVLGEGTPAFTAPADLTLLEARCFDGLSNVLLRALLGVSVRSVSPAALAGSRWALGGKHGGP